MAKQVELIAAPGGGVSQLSSTDNVMAIIAKASESGRSADELDKLLTLFERVADRQAAQEYADAMAQFQQECPSIEKTETVDFVSNSGQRVTYNFANLNTIKVTVQPILHGLGLSFRWDSEPFDGQLKCICTLKHRNGHKETATFIAPVGGTPLMSAAQKAKGALTFAMRVSLMQVLGLTDCETDCDGVQPGADHPVETITPDQAATILDWMDILAMGELDRTRVLSWAGCDSVETTPKDKFEPMLEIFRKKQAKAKVQG